VGCFFDLNKMMRKREIIMEDKNKKKESKLVFDPKVTRKLLKMNGEIKFCPYCGAKIEDGCECHKNIVVDVKPYRNENGEIEPNRSVMVFQNNKSFQDDYTQIKDEMTAKNIELDFEIEIEVEEEQLSMDLD
jgi:hypothetical protein